MNCEIDCIYFDANSPGLVSNIFKFGTEQIRHVFFKNSIFFEIKKKGKCSRLQNKLQQPIVPPPPSTRRTQFLGREPQHVEITSYCVHIPCSNYCNIQLQLRKRLRAKCNQWSSRLPVWGHGLVDTCSHWPPSGNPWRHRYESCGLWSHLLVWLGRYWPAESTPHNHNRKSKKARRGRITGLYDKQPEWQQDPYCKEIQTSHTASAQTRILSIQAG